MNQDITIRAAVEADIPAIGHIAESSELFPAQYLPDMIAPFLRAEENDHIWRVANLGSETVAFVYCEAERMTNGAANMLALATASHHRSNGVGARLVSHLEELCQQRGDRILLVETSGMDGFARTRAFYRREGYEEVARLPDFYDAGDDKIVFMKRLTQ